MPEVPIYWVGIAMLLTVVGGTLLGNWVRNGWREVEQHDEDRLPDEEHRTLDHPWMQRQLQRLIDRHGLAGSCQIVDGRVMRREVDGERQPFVKAIRSAVEGAVYAAGGNSNLAIYTYREGRMIPVGQLSLDDLLGFAAMLETRE